MERLRGKRQIALPASDVDPRVVLETARMHDWVHGISEHELDSWQQAHPVMDATMWAVAMDVGIRLHNLALGCRMSGNCSATHHAAICVHAAWVWEHLETSGGMATSHLLGGLLGIVSAAATVSDSGVIDLGEEAARMLRAEIVHQILQDGMSFEASTGYHRHVVDILVWATESMLQHPRMASSVDDVWLETLRRATEALAVLEHCGMPLIGDNDDGMAVKTESQYPSTPSTALLWRTYVTISKQTVPPPPTQPCHIPFEEFGLDVWQREAYTLTARCGVVGQYGKGGHAHNDQNSITLRIKNVPVLVDAGSYVYTSDPERRNSDRSTRSHNTVCSMHEQRAWPRGADGLFWLIHSLPEPVVEERSRHSFVGRVVHQNKRGFEHRRSMRLHDMSIEIVDEFGSGSAVADMVLVVASGVTVQPTSTGVLLVGNFGSATVHTGVTPSTVENFPIAHGYLLEDLGSRIVTPMQGGRMEWTITLCT